MLAVVICAIALTLAYPIRAYVAELRQISQLESSNAQVARQVQRLKAEQRELKSPAYIEQLARDELEMCFPTQTCYVVVGPSKPHSGSGSVHATTPWYSRLWQSVRAADKVFTSR